MKKLLHYIEVLENLTSVFASFLEEVKQSAEHWESFGDEIQNNAEIVNKSAKCWEKINSDLEEECCYVCDKKGCYRCILIDLEANVECPPKHCPYNVNAETKWEQIK